MATGTCHFLSAKGASGSAKWPDRPCGSDGGHQSWTKPKQSRSGGRSHSLKSVCMSCSSRHCIEILETQVCQNFLDILGGIQSSASAPVHSKFVLVVPPTQQNSFGSKGFVVEGEGRKVPLCERALFCACNNLEGRRKPSQALVLNYKFLVISSWNGKSLRRGAKSDWSPQANQ